MTGQSSDDMPRLFTAQHVLTWGQFRRGNPRWSGEILFLEGERLAWRLDKEIGVQFPDHEIDWNAVTLEVRLQYIVPEEARRSEPADRSIPDSP